MDKKLVYADNAATTPVDPRVRDKMLPLSLIHISDIPAAFKAAFSMPLIP